MGNFQEKLYEGQAAESAIASWLISRGSSVLPVYEKLVDTGKGPQVFSLDESFAAPDLFVFTGNGALWIESKHKTAFTWHRITSRFVTGIDLNHYEDYCQIEDRLSHPVWILFFHKGGAAKDSPPSPSGLYGQLLSGLRGCENHRHANHGRYGMVYWAIDKLKYIASYEDVMGVKNSSLTKGIAC